MNPRHAFVACVAGGLLAACVVLFGGAAPEPPRGTATVLDFGAKGDGRADDTAAFERAIAAGGGVRVPRGVYRLTRSLVVPLAETGVVSFSGDGTARLVMTAAGPALRFVGSHTTGTADPESFRPGVLDRERMPAVDGLEIVGEHAEADGIAAEGTMQLTISRTRISHCRHAIRLQRRNRNVIVSDCHLYDNRGIGVFYDDVSLHQSNLVGCHISYCLGGGVVCRGGDVRNIHIGTCDLESNHDPQGPPTANVLIDCSGSVNGTAEVAITGCTIQHNSKSPDSANIRIVGRGAENAKGGRADWGHVTISGNVFSDVATNVHLVGTRGVTLTGNTFWMGYEYNLLVEDCRQIVLGANVCERNPAYAYGTAATTKNAVRFARCADCTVVGLHVQGVNTVEAGVVLEDCTRFNVTGCTILDCGPVGLLRKNVTDSHIGDCLIRPTPAAP